MRKPRQCFVSWVRTQTSRSSEVLLKSLRLFCGGNGIQLATLLVVGALSARGTNAELPLLTLRPTCCCSYVAAATFILLLLLLLL